MFYFYNSFFFHYLKKLFYRLRSSIQFLYILLLIGTDFVNNTLIGPKLSYIFYNGKIKRKEY